MYTNNNINGIITTAAIMYITANATTAAANVISFVFMACPPIIGSLEILIAY